MGDVQHARDAKAAKDALMADLRCGSKTIAETLTGDLTPISRTALWTVLLTAHRMGPAGAEHTCMKSGVWPQTQVGDLTPLQVEVIIQSLPKRAR